MNASPAPIFVNRREQTRENNKKIAPKRSELVIMS